MFKLLLIFDIEREKSRMTPGERLHMAYCLCPWVICSWDVEALDLISLVLLYGDHKPMTHLALPDLTFLSVNAAKIWSQIACYT